MQTKDRYAGTHAATYDPVVQFLYNIVNHSVILFGQEKGFTLKMEPNVVCGTIPMQKNPFLNGAKQSQTSPNCTKLGPNAPNEAQQAKQCERGANLLKMGPTVANRSHLEPTWPCNGFYMSLHMMDERLNSIKKKINRFLEQG